MNLSAPLGLILGLGIVILVATSGTSNSGVFFDLRAALLVCGGTIAVGIICFSFDQILSLFKLTWNVILGKTRREMLVIIKEITRVAEVTHNGGTIESELKKVKNAFFKEALQLIVDGGLNAQELDEVLMKRLELQFERNKQESLIFKTIGRFPPAFGLVGTTIGMISLLQGLGGANAFDKIGPSMSVALVATFYGLIVANVFLIPIGENLRKATYEELMLRRAVIDGVRLIQEKKHPLLVNEYLKGYLAKPNDLKKAKG